MTIGLFAELAIYCMKNKETVVSVSEMTGTAVFSFIGFGCQKVDFNLVAGKLHKAETVFVTLGEN